MTTRHLRSKSRFAVPPKKKNIKKLTWWLRSSVAQQKSSHHVNTKKDGIVKQSGNDVEGYRSKMVLFQPNVCIFLQHSVINDTWHSVQSKDLSTVSQTINSYELCGNDKS